MYMCTQIQYSIYVYWDIHTHTETHIIYMKYTICMYYYRLKSRSDTVDYF